MAKHQITGRQGEALARQYLEKEGYEILETNWRFAHAEIDIICGHKGLIVFVEVKTRSRSLFGEPEDAVDDRKKELLLRAATEYMVTHAVDTEIRFDIIAIVLEGTAAGLKHYTDAWFPYDL